MSYILTINGIEQDLAARKVSLRSLDVSCARPDRLTFAQHVPHTAADFGVEDDVVLSVDGTIRFRGRIKRVEHQGKPGAESVVYTALGLRELARAVSVREPDSGIPRVVFNAPADDEDYSPDRSAWSVGEIVKWLFDSHGAELRAAGAIPPEPAPGYVAEELDELDVAPSKIIFNSINFDAALAALMRFQRGCRFLPDAETQVWHFRALSDLPEKTITYNSPDRPLSAQLKPSTRARATAVEIIGPPQPVIATLHLSEDELTPLWNPDLEADWTWARCFDPANDDSYVHVFRRFQVTDESKRRLARVLPEPVGLGEHPASRAPQVYRKADDDAWALVAACFDFDSGIITLAQPATTGDEYEEGAAACAGDVALVCAYLGDPLSVRYPETGYEGTAHTKPSNPVSVVRRIYDEDFIRPEQAEQYRDLARELLRSTEDIIYAGTVRLGRLDWSLGGLGHRLNFAAQDDNGFPVETGFENLAATLLGVTYDFAESRSDLHLSTDPLETARGGSWLTAELRELAAQTRRTERRRAAEICAGADSARLGNDGQTGAPAGSRGVYSVRRYEDGESDRVAGHVELEAGPGVSIERQVGEGRNGFKICAGRSHLLWFHLIVLGSNAGETIDMHARLLGSYESLEWYPVLAGRLTKIIAWTPETLTAGTITVMPSRKTKSESAACPESRTDHESPAVQLSASTNIGHAIAESGEPPGIPFLDDDLVGLRAALSADFEIPGSTLLLLAAASFEEEE